GKARGATLRRDLIDVAARTARHGRGEITLHLPEGWHRKTEWMNLFQAATAPPAQAACPARTRSPHLHRPRAPADASQDPGTNQDTPPKRRAPRKPHPPA